MRMSRWTVFILLVPVYTVAMLFVGTVLLGVVVTEWPDSTFDEFIKDIIDVLDDPEWWVYGGMIAAVSVALQAVFLLPMFGRQPPRGERSRSLLVSLCLGAFLTTALMVGLYFGLVNLLQLLFPENPILDHDRPWFASITLLIFLGGWGFWTVCLLVYVQDIWADRILGRMVRLLLVGTALEVLLVLPIDIMVRRKTSCYCGELTFFALCIGVAAALWLSGPGIVIALLSKKQRGWRKTHCGHCGYPKGPTPSEMCPECGFDWSKMKPEKGG